MASANGTRTRVHCRNFQAGFCRFGELCNYYHEIVTPNGGNFNQSAKGHYGNGNRSRFEQVQQNKPYRNTNPSNQPGYLNRRSYGHKGRYTNRPHYNSHQPERYHQSASNRIYQNMKNFDSCSFSDNRKYAPGLRFDRCNICGIDALHPYNSFEKERHLEQCKESHRLKVEQEEALNRSKEKTCGICLDVILDKKRARFGLLDNCDHVFCLECIRTWRSSQNFESKMVKACPECRTKSYFITPANYWPKDKQDKEDLIRAHKEKLKTIECRNFQRGEGTCSFGSKCFYLHLDKEGNVVELPPPNFNHHQRTDQEDTEELTDLFIWSLLTMRNRERIRDSFNMAPFIIDDDDEDEDDDDFTNESDLNDDTGSGDLDYSLLLFEE